MKVILIVFVASKINAQDKPVEFYEIQRQIHDDFTECTSAMRVEFGKPDSTFLFDSVKRTNYQNAWFELYKTFIKKKEKLVKQLPYAVYPDVVFKDFEDNTHALSDFSDKKVILNYNYMFCDKCINEIDSLIAKGGSKAKIIVLLYDNKNNCTEIYERFGSKILMGFISEEAFSNYGLKSSPPATFLLHEGRLIKYFTSQDLISSFAFKELYKEIESF